MMIKFPFAKNVQIVNAKLFQQRGFLLFEFNCSGHKVLMSVWQMYFTQRINNIKVGLVYTNRYLAKERTLNYCFPIISFQQLSLRTLWQTTPTSSRQLFLIAKNTDLYFPQAKFMTD